jgi:hypothetical protein
MTARPGFFVSLHLNIFQRPANFDFSMSQMRPVQTRGSTGTGSLEERLLRKIPDAACFLFPRFIAGS